MNYKNDVSKELDTLFRAILHELVTPINAVKGYSDLLRIYIKDGALASDDITPDDIESAINGLVFYADKLDYIKNLAFNELEKVEEKNT